MVVSDDDGEELVNALRADGMLSAVIDEWRLNYIEEWKAWFGFARELNRSTLSLWLAHWSKGEGGSSAARLPTSSRMLGRALNAFCAAVVLCERGAAIEAACLARGISEASFWLAYLAAEPEAAMSALEADDLKNFIEREGELQRISADDLEALSASKAREVDYRTRLGDRKKPSIAAIARDHGEPQAYLKYRILSGFYGHLSQASLRHNFLSTGEASGLNILGPHAGEIGKALYFSGASLIDCAMGYCRIVEDVEAPAAFAELREGLIRLRDAEGVLSVQDPEAS